MWGDFTSCDENLKPILNTKDSHSYSTLHVKGSYLFVCVWIAHFGHSFMDLLHPAFKLNLNTNNDLKLLTFGDHASTSNVTEEVLQSLAPVISLNSIISNALNQKKSIICFENAFIGMKRNGVVNPFDLLPHSYSNLRHIMLTKYNKDIIVKRIDYFDCNAILLDRKNRRIINSEELLITMKNLLGDQCQVQALNVSNSFVQQIKYFSKVTILISLTGTGSHHMIWLPDGAISLMFIHPSFYDINGSICSTMPNIYCDTLASRFNSNITNSNPKDQFNSDVYGNIDEFKSKLSNAFLWQQKYLEVYKMHYL